MRNTKTGVLLGDQRADALYLLLDENGDGDALDANERLVFFDATNASGVLTPTNNIFTVIQAKDKTVYLGDGNTDAVYRLEDQTRDGDANDAGVCLPARLRSRSLSSPGSRHSSRSPAQPVWPRRPAGDRPSCQVASASASRWRGP